MSVLQIEAAFLNNNASVLNLREIKALTKSLTTATKKRFSTSVQLAAHVAQAAQWFKSAEGKAAMQEAGIQWTTEQFAEKAFGWKKSFYHRMVKVGGLEQEIVDNFTLACDTAESEGEPAERSLEQLLRFAKGGGVTQQTEGEEGEGSGEEGEGGGEQPTGTIFTMAFKGENGNVAVRIDAAGIVKTSNSREEIEAAVAFLMASLNA